MEKRVIILYGPPGIGKTTVGKELVKEFDQSMFLDVDHLWDIHPFVVNSDHIAMVEENISSMLSSFYQNPSLQTLVLVWVIHTKELHQFFQRLTKEMEERYFVLLTAEKEVLAKRMIKASRSEKNIDYALYLLDKYPKLEDYLIDTSAKTIEEIVKEIKQKICEKNR